MIQSRSVGTHCTMGRRRAMQPRPSRCAGLRGYRRRPRAGDSPNDTSPNRPQGLAGRWGSGGVVDLDWPSTRWTDASSWSISTPDSRLSSGCINRGRHRCRPCLASRHDRNVHPQRPPVTRRRFIVEQLDSAVYMGDQPPRTPSVADRPYAPSSCGSHGIIPPGSRDGLPPGRSRSDFCAASDNLPRRFDMRIASVQLNLGGFLTNLGGSETDHVGLPTRRSGRLRSN